MKNCFTLVVVIVVVVIVVVVIVVVIVVVVLLCPFWFAVCSLTLALLRKYLYQKLMLKNFN